MIKIYIEEGIDFCPDLPKDCEFTDHLGNAELAFVKNYSAARSQACLVACLEQAAVMKMTEDEIGAFNDIWFLPVIPQLWQSRLDKLVDQMRNLNTFRLEKVWLDTLMDSIPNMIWFKSLDGLHMKVNQAFCKAAGKTRKMIEGKDHYFIWNVDKNSADHDDTCINSEAEVIKANKTCTFDETLKIGNQKRRLITYKTPIHDRHGNIIGTVGVAQDVTNILNLNMEMEIFLEAMPFPIVIHNDKGIITHLNQRFTDYFHERKDDIVGVNYNDWKSWFFTQEMNSLSFMDADEKRFVSIRETSMRDIFGAVFGGVVVFSDITAEKKLEIQIHRNANEDHLTGLANRHAVDQYFKHAVSGIFHLLYVDLDNFKSVNDRWGHETGDQALKKLADVMRETCPDDFIARLGGDEFLICIHHEREESELVSLADSIREKLEEWFKASHKLSGVSVSIGVRANCTAETPVGQLIHEADQAMYEAKRNGKSQTRTWHA
ncbi:MAG: diguanylate cyclase [Alistipes senegalensis]|nr:diguanylate cyclase [Oxalobacter formigenes]MCM1280735.1 diguanylate cyclase [Alistipes senegalensis]